VSELAFVDEDSLLSWIETQPHRDRTRTTRNFFIGLRYTREKKAEGAPPGNQHKKSTGKKVASCSTAERVAAEEGCSHQHVKTCANFAEHLNRVCKPGGGLEWVRDLILTERIKYSRLMLDELAFRGAGGCREQVRERHRPAPTYNVTCAAIRGQPRHLPCGVHLMTTTNTAPRPTAPLPGKPAATAAQVRLWLAHAAAIRAAEAAEAAFEEFAALTDSDPDAPPCESWHVAPAQRREGALHAAYALRMSLERDIDSETPEEVAYLLGRYAAFAGRTGPIVAAHEVARGDCRARVERRFGALLPDAA
jgi:hypothetical protein